ncbi:hypothetical protein DCAR_0310230 [Daucus carota subsp. sativus]|uniref:Uncharacterized protein n=1 Tax=Daucus carota subsp. sativus TaxID=79200 RepID=A0AAF0WJF3_DAUCS|nr:PREDICTED: cytochrome P450 93A3-like [Daucus carota subsp. sativus]WOG90982.1 hypothetical protein DCAR_0310230 [Daucus carota subsp. sativus]
MTDYQVYLVYSLLLIISSITLRGIFKTRNTSSLPPSPPRIPIIGHLHLLAPIPHQALHKLSTRYGPLIHLFLGSKPCIVASSPEMATEILKTHEASWLDRPKTEAVDYLTYGSQDFAFATYGPYWKFVKKLCMSELLSGRTLDLLQPIRRHEIESMVNAMMKKARAGEAADVRVELIRLANNTFSSLFMGKRWSENEDEAEEVHKLIQEITELAGKFNFSDYIWFCKNLDLQGIRKRVVDVRGRFDNMMERIIEDRVDLRRTRKQNGIGGHLEKNLLDILLDISEDESREIKLSRENIKAFTLDLFFAGSETSATATEWALAELINHPDIMKEARQEIDTVVGKNRLVEESDIINLPYLQSIVKETLRLHPPGPLIEREASEDCTIANYQIPAKTRLFVNVWALGRDSDYWENAPEFIPERFFLSSEDKRNGKSQLDVRGQHFQVLPFGSGRRGCPGISLALRSVQTTLAVLIQCFEWEVRGEGQNGGSTVNMEEGTGLTISRARPLVCVPVARLDPFPSM